MRKLGFLIGLLGLGGAVLASSAPVSAAGDAEAGKAAFAKCGICHQVGPDAQVVVGPPLTGVVGRKAASFEGFAYSAGMKKLGEEGFVWTPEHISQFIADPKAMVPDSPMALAFQGVPDEAERANIIAYLQTQK